MEGQKLLIINTALEHFKRYGIKSISVDDLTHSLGMSKKTFYQYFPGKEELVKTVLDEMNNRAYHQALDYMKGKSAVQCIRLLMDMHKKAGEVHKEPAFAYDLRKYYPSLYKKHIADIHLNIKDVLMRHLKQGIDEGVYRADLDVEMCAVMYSLIQQAFMRRENEIQDINPKRLIAFTLDSFLRSIVSEEGKSLIKIDN